MAISLVAKKGLPQEATL